MVKRMANGPGFGRRNPKTKPRHDLVGTARTDCRETARGGTRRVWLGRHIYGSPMECLGNMW